MIRFMSKPGTQTSLAVELIKNGLYSTNTSGGVPAGSYKVDIRSFHPNDPTLQYQYRPLRGNNFCHNFFTVRLSSGLV